MKHITTIKILVKILDNWNAKLQSAHTYVGRVNHNHRNAENNPNQYARFHNWVEKKVINHIITKPLNTILNAEDISEEV